MDGQRETKRRQGQEEEVEEVNKDSPDDNNYDGGMKRTDKYSM